MRRQSIDATYDSRDTGHRFHVTTQVGDNTIAFRERVPDPFVRHTVTVGLWDALRFLLRGRPVEVTVIVDGDREVVNDVMELDYNTLVPGSTRRDDWDQHVHDRLNMMGRGEDDTDSATRKG